MALRKHYGTDFKFFAMQSAVIQHIMLASRVQRSGDVVLRSPTGSGKTLAFTIPIVERLRNRTVPRLRAVIVVPTHDLAAQIMAVFELLTEGSDIRIVLATGASSVTVESRMAVEAEVLIATPGRLLDHVENTPGVTLAFVEFLILDESDRLLQDAFYGWADTVLPKCGVRDVNEDLENMRVHRIGPSAGVLSLAIPSTAMTRHVRTSITRKILVSATATKDPQRIAKLHLHRVTFFEPTISETKKEKLSTNGEDGQFGDEDVENYCVPTGLTECAYVFNYPQQKPMGLLSVLGWNPTDKGWSTPVTNRGAKLVFTKSVEAAHRLARLLELFAWKEESRPIVLEISREVAVFRREVVLKKLAEREERSIIVVCSDMFARGIDIPGVDAIINYDAPPRLHTYLHRVGRTARAGKEGVAVTLLLSKQVRHFKAMVKDIDRGERKCRVMDMKLDPLKRAQNNALLSKRLVALKRVVRREALGLIHLGECLPDHLLAEMNVKDEEVLNEVKEKRLGRLMNGENPPKRARIEHDTVAENGDKVAGADEAELEIDDDIEDEVVGVEDSFRDLLTAQVAFNWLREQVS